MKKVDLPENRLFSSPEETASYAAGIAAGLAPGTVLALTGPLGSGKTVFVKGLGRGLGISEDRITSPTFTIINEYDGREGLVHVDLYRLEKASEIDELGLEEYFSGDRIVAVEWADRALRLFPQGTMVVSFEIISKDRRRLGFSWL